MHLSSKSLSPRHARQNAKQMSDRPERRIGLCYLTMRSQNHPSKSARGARANFPSNFLSRCHLSTRALIYSRSGAAVGDEHITRPTMGRDGNDFPRPRVRIYTLDRMRGIEARRDNAEKRRKWEKPRGRCGG